MTITSNFSEHMNSVPVTVYSTLLVLMTETWDCSSDFFKSFFFETNVSITSMLLMF